jgi:hypothetical protein
MKLTTDAPLPFSSGQQLTGKIVSEMTWEDLTEDIREKVAMPTLTEDLCLKVEYDLRLTAYLRAVDQFHDIDHERYGAHVETVAQSLGELLAILRALGQIQSECSLFHRVQGTFVQSWGQAFESHFDLAYAEFACTSPPVSFASSGSSSDSDSEEAGSNYTPLVTEASLTAP